MTPPCVVPTFRPYTVENLEFGGFYAWSCESRVSEAGEFGEAGAGPGYPCPARSTRVSDSFSRNGL